MEWRKILYAIAEVLNDAEEKQLISEAVKLWLDDLKNLAYDVEDILDKISTEMLRRKLKEKQRAGISKVRSLIPKVKLLQFSMNSEIKEITQRLQEISKQKDELGLIYIGTTTTNKAWRRPPSSSVLSGVPVVGRDDDKAKIIELLSRDEPATVNYDVVAIVGMPGVRKTTFAQVLVKETNDTMIQFNPKVWISVSDDFNLVRVTKTILESITSQPCHFEELNNVQESLSKVLESKKFLLILDDVWSTCDYDMWMKLQSPFRAGARGSKILVTTREAKVARTMGATKVHNLQCLSNDDCWKVFEQHAFDNNNALQPNFVLLRDKIVARCGGLPLAARTLGGLLRCKEIVEWGEVLNNKLWSTSNKSEILPVLKLSHHYLPSNLKRCFAYCSILPNDYDFAEKQLILLWMAEGLLQLPEERKEMEDIGGDNFAELLSRSLFQRSSKANSLYIMHDLVGDLARWLQESYVLDSRINQMLSNN
ncbi:putative disease resistance RPP13-like protein 1 isoform X2 [Malus domestica]|uniref:putative disease resistance RPP13-like protein 1 isoform X2 n=1 Tax=Malus domestica TaxID=3750 RepID=UPI000498FF64|nr:putative disease resistance RPP13-like protein 1 isoform X2 [Malus domestica]